MKRQSSIDRELPAVLQLFRAQQKIPFRYEISQGPKVGEVEETMPDGQCRTQEIFNDTIIGYITFDAEVIRITVEESTFERPKEAHMNSI